MSEFIRDHLYDWLNNGFLNDGLDAYDKTIIKENEEIRFRKLFPDLLVSTIF